MTTPLFSIGVPTYNRRELLKENIASITRQTFADFEVIVGNSYTREVLSAESLCVDDPRIHFVNHPKDPGVLGGYNALPKKARGRYFIWLADDDFFAPDFLQTIYTALIRFNFPHCVYTTYTMGANYLVEENGPVKEPRLLTGRQFLHEYLARSLKVVGCCGAFDLQYLMCIGGMEMLANRISPYSDNLLAIRCGLLEKVVYIDAPLVFFRGHKGSISYTSTDLDSYSSAQINLLDKSVGVFRSDGLKEDFRSNLYMLLKWCIGDYLVVVARSKRVQWRKLVCYLISMRTYTKLLGRSQYKAVIAALYIAGRVLVIMVCSRLKRRFARVMQRS